MQMLINGLQAGNRSGTGRYTVELVHALLKLDIRYELILIWPDRITPPPPHDGLTVIKRPTSIGRRILFDQLGLPELRRRYAPQVVHYPANIGPLFHQPGVVLTVHDLSFVRHPEWFRPERAAYYRFAVRRSARLAQRILADSRATAEDLQGFWNIPAEKIDVVPLGVSPHFQPASLEEQARVRRQYGLDTNFFLYYGTVEPRKNLPRLLAAWNRVADQIPHTLVIAGRTGWKNVALQKQLQQMKHPDRIQFTDYIPQRDLPAVISSAHAFVWPSLFEGFGLPPLEAMACGIPVLTSTTSSLPEVTGDAALLVDPTSVEAIADGMLQLAQDHVLCEGLREKGKKRAAKFTWQRTAQQTLAAYQHLLDDGYPL